MSRFAGDPTYVKLYWDNWGKIRDIYKHPCYSVWSWTGAGGVHGRQGQGKFRTAYDEIDWIQSMCTNSVKLQNVMLNCDRLHLANIILKYVDLHVTVRLQYVMFNWCKSCPHPTTVCMSIPIPMSMHENPGECMKIYENL